MTDIKQDQRIRLRYQASAFGDGELYPGILKPLEETGGMMFPYTPSIQISQEVDYSTVSLVHSNQDYNSFTRSPQASISISGKFTVQNYAEGKYAMAALHFLRSASKMYFGDEDVKTDRAGIPPPVLLLDGYGKSMFNNVKVLLKSHSYSFEDTMDTIPIFSSTEANVVDVRLPAMFTVQVMLTPQQTPQVMRKEFSLESFRSGALLNKGGFF
jgi:hypothetical protein